ncbi:hypothetical protein M2302_004495 [Micromonospora sp. A200]|uniref:hypothetical protein n=1 Tax=Micromonospora sp. A200 TaxID=2940568 RepID=UPI002475ED13|nr:hypothetical protein [Micromonospora sp. A200]MDH6464297.1 hypothetical protein [Micromonospora sp. A200]
MIFSSEVLDSAAADPASPAWSLIWDESCHQGTFDPASGALLPWLARTCASFAPERRDGVVALAGFIAVDATDADRVAYSQEIATLRRLAVECLPGASTDRDFVLLQQAVLGFDGDEIWGKEPDLVIDGEVDVQCPECEDELCLDLMAEDSPIEPWLTSHLAVRIHAEAVEAGRNSLATAFTYLFGRVHCPNCGTRFDLADQVGRVSWG